MNNSALPPYPFPGPAPDMSRPSMQSTIKAEVALRIATDTSGYGGKGISEEDAQTLLKLVVHTQRAKFTKDAYGGDRASFEQDSGGLFGLCGNSAVYSFLTAKQFGVSNDVNNPLQIRQNDLLQGEDCQPHGFAVLTLPVRNAAGGVNDKSFVIDTTYRQFFVAEQPNAMTAELKDKNIPIASPGHVITKTREGREIADKILKHGFIELDEKTARLYVSSFSGGVQKQGNYMESLVKPKEKLVASDFTVPAGVPLTPLNTFITMNSGKQRTGRE